LSKAGQGIIGRSKEEVWPLVELAVKEVTAGLDGPLLEQITEIEARLAAQSLNNRAKANAPLQLTPSNDADVPSIVALMNRAYRGAGASAGWTTEADYIAGERTNAEMLRQQIADSPAGSMLLWRRQGDHHLLGCVWVERETDDTWYLGSLTVDPAHQNRGLGRILLTAAETWIRKRGGRSIRMTVVHIRDTLLEWYARRGYVLTDETEPFPYDDQRFGIPNRDDLHFAVLRKPLA
jgi:ribosomal protein S18 acetylase RimI-like enzyme